MKQIKLCKRGHERTPENVNGSGGCRLCVKLYNQTQERKDIVAQYRQTAKGAKVRADYDRTPASKARHLKYSQLAHRRDIQRVERASPGRKAYMLEYMRSLPDSLVAQHIGLKVSEVPQDIIEIKRLTIQLQRSLKNGNQTQCSGH